ncbi:MAG: hypothetical protein VX007_11785, partial [Pseudomonadota bacterium]|nr:hypothetical protein [Pseudomonadota bacterium]
MNRRNIEKGIYPYPSHGIHQFAGWGFAFGASASFFASGSSLGAGGWYGLSVLFSSDMGRTSLNELDVAQEAANGGLDVVG